MEAARSPLREETVNTDCRGNFREWVLVMWWEGKVLHENTREGRTLSATRKTKPIGVCMD